MGILIKRINGGISGEWEAVEDAQEIAFTNICVHQQQEKKNKRRRGEEEEGTNR